MITAERHCFLKKRRDQAEITGYGIAIKIDGVTICRSLLFSADGLNDAEAFADRLNGVLSGDDTSD